KARKEPLEHVALFGPPGVGKTSLANVIAHELGVPIRVTSGPAIERQADLAAILTSLPHGEVLFIDEIHRLPRIAEEGFYLAVAKEALGALEVDEHGLDDLDRKLLGAIVDKFSGGPVGLDTLGAALTEDAETIEDVYEPYLLREGFLMRTRRGRVATERAYR